MARFWSKQDELWAAMREDEETCNKRRQCKRKVEQYERAKEIINEIGYA